MASAFKSITANDFAQEVLAHPKPVVVFFWSHRSDACRIFVPPVEGYVAELPRRPKLVKVNVDQHPEAARMANIGAVPALLVYKGGEVVTDLIGTGTFSEVEALFAAASTDDGSADGPEGLG